MMNTGEDKVEDKIGFIREKEQKDMEKIILQTEKLALDAVEKERKIENIIEREEEEKEEFQINQVKKKYEKIRQGKVSFSNNII